MRVDPEHDEAKHEEIVGYEVGSDIGCSVDVLASPEVIHVCNLEEEDDSPVDVDDDMI